MVCTAFLPIAEAIAEGFESTQNTYFICDCCSGPKKAEKPRKMSCAPGQDALLAVRALL